VSKEINAEVELIVDPELEGRKVDEGRIDVANGVIKMAKR
jgi:hypothetical protein